MAWRVVYFGLAAFLIHSASMARTFPPNCFYDNHRLEGSMLYLNTDEKKPERKKYHEVFVIENVSEQPVVLDKPDGNDFIESSYRAELLPGKYSAFAVNRQGFSLTCTDTENVATNCDDKLRVCHIRVSRFELSNFGNYWITENQAENRLIRQIRKRGIWVRYR